MVVREITYTGIYREGKTSTCCESLMGEDKADKSLISDYDSIEIIVIHIIYLSQLHLPANNYYEVYNPPSSSCLSSPLLMLTCIWIKLQHIFHEIAYLTVPCKVGHPTLILPGVSMLAETVTISKLRCIFCQCIVLSLIYSVIVILHT